MPILQKLHEFLHPSHFNDTVLAKSRKLHLADVPLGSKVAIYLIFPSKGLLASHEVALVELARSGYAPLVVSNLPLAPEALARLAPLAWRILERANFGYDFGGYREALLWLQPHLHSFDRLILMNDSVWFPIPGAMDWIAQAEALNRDLVGSVCTGFSGRMRAHLFRETPWQVDMARPGVHYGSFALMLSRKLMQDSGFLRFWRRLRLSQGKTRTIKRGEIGFTQWVMRHGFSHGATSDLSRLDKVLAEQSESALDQIFANLIIVQDEKADRQRLKLSEKPLTRAEKEAFIRMVVARRGPSLSLPGIMINDFEFAFLKKYATKSASQDKDKIYNVINSLKDPMRSVVFAETELHPPQ
jgi:Rhamnan synthesis protein F